MNAFFIVPTSVKGAVQTLFATHPPMEKRIERLSRSSRRSSRAPPPQLAARGLPRRPARRQEQAQGRRAGPAVRHDDRVRARCRPARDMKSTGGAGHRLPAARHGRLRADPQGRRGAAARHRRGDRVHARVRRRRVRLPLDHPARPRLRRPRGVAEHALDRAPGRRLRRPPAGRGVLVRGAKAKRVHFIYNFKRGAFYPFVPAPGDKQRDSERELRLKAQLDKRAAVRAGAHALVPAVGDPALVADRWSPVVGLRHATSG